MIAPILTLTGNLDLATLRELLWDAREPVPADPFSEVSPEDLAAYRLDMTATPTDLPTAAEVLDLARLLGLDEVPF